MQTSTIHRLKKPTSTMSLENNEFQVYLPSNVKVNPRNKPYLYETELSKPMDLPGEWDVALINVSYPHNWENLDKSYSYFILRLKKSDETKSKYEPRQIYDDIEIYNIVTKLPEFQGWLVERGPKIAQGNYDISTNITSTRFSISIGLWQ